LLVLIVDDTPAISALIALTIGRQEGWDTEIASDGVEGLAKALNFLPDLIISDIEMPRMSGLNLLREIRHNIALKDTPVILMSGAIDQEEKREEATERGANAFLAKPFNLEVLLETVQRVILGEQLL